MYPSYCTGKSSAGQRSLLLFYGTMPVILHPEEREAWLRDDTFMMLVLARAGPELVLEQVVNTGLGSGQVSLF